jgi:hypothetical protein
VRKRAGARRSATQPPWRLGWFTNRLLVFTAIGETLFALACLGVGPIADALENTFPPLAAAEAPPAGARTCGPTALPLRVMRWFIDDMNDLTIHIHTCPFCELRFQFVNEVRDHVVTDHPEHADSFVGIVPHEQG